MNAKGELVLSFSSVRYYVDNTSNNSSEGELHSNLNSAVKDYDNTLGSEEELELSLKSVKDYNNASDDMEFSMKHLAKLLLASVCWLQIESSQKTLQEELKKELQKLKEPQKGSQKEPQKELQKGSQK